MKTPEQIASETLTRSTRSPMDVHAHIVAAIEADRAQRAARLDDLHAYDHTGWDDDQERILIVQIDTPEAIGRMRVYINDGRIYDGDPETGQEWSLT